MRSIKGQETNHIQIMLLNKLDQFLSSVDESDMDNFIDFMIDDNEFNWQDSYCNSGAIADSEIDWISRHDINV